MTLDDIQAIIKPHNDKLIAEGRANKIEAENRRLRAALRKIGYAPEGGTGPTLSEAIKIARDVLKE